MNIHEHQAKTLLAEFGVPVPRGYPAFSVDEAVAAAEKLGGPVWVVKAQIHAGGRGKGGGVKLARSLDEVRAEATTMLGMTLVTHQTGPKGKLVRRLYIEEGAAIAKEYYLSLLVDRETSRVAVVASTEGGMDIEQVAHETPQLIHTFSIDPATGIWPHHALMLSKALGLTLRVRTVVMHGRSLRAVLRRRRLLRESGTSAECKNEGCGEERTVHRSSSFGAAGEMPCLHE